LGVDAQTGWSNPPASNLVSTFPSVGSASNTSKGRKQNFISKLLNAEKGECKVLI